MLALLQEPLLGSTRSEPLLHNRWLRIHRPISHQIPRMHSTSRAEINSNWLLAMTNGVIEFCSSDIEETKKLVVYVVIGSLIIPCMVGIALSQELSRWPIGEASFKIWWSVLIASLLPIEMTDRSQKAKFLVVSHSWRGASPELRSSAWCNERSTCSPLLSGSFCFCCDHERYEQC